MENSVTKEILDLFQILKDHKCIDPQLIDVRENCNWTDYILIGTVSSKAHMSGVAKYVYEFLDNAKIEVRRNIKNLQDENWLFIDCNYFVVHLMDSNARNFYDIETLWHDSKFFN